MKGNKLTKYRSIARKAEDKLGEKLYTGRKIMQVSIKWKPLTVLYASEVH